MQRAAVGVEQLAELSVGHEVIAVSEGGDTERVPGPGGYAPALRRIDAGQGAARAGAGCGWVCAHGQDGGDPDVGRRRRDPSGRPRPGRWPRRRRPRRGPSGRCRCRSSRALRALRRWRRERQRPEAGARLPGVGRPPARARPGATRRRRVRLGLRAPRRSGGAGAGRACLGGRTDWCRPCPDLQRVEVCGWRASRCRLASSLEVIRGRATAWRLAGAPDWYTRPLPSGERTRPGEQAGRSLPRRRSAPTARRRWLVHASAQPARRAASCSSR